jgi:hypothetical protein
MKLQERENEAKKNVIVYTPSPQRSVIRMLTGTSLVYVLTQKPRNKKRLG